ncbi:uncharacterized protein A4U43_UnF7920 [Asparagus officinalis]|uniref:Uncharacterized protein n=1 Tax=Asparagus officinalis TaxID=4686 RepID=A0A1R3L633_ASPOF|nr:uncharacterized protein A4U43_UnF7920 [Asparagus officinalis]
MESMIDSLKVSDSQKSADIDKLKHELLERNKRIKFLPEEADKSEKRRRRLSRGREPQGVVDSGQINSAEAAKVDISALSLKDGPSSDIPLSKIADVVILDVSSSTRPIGEEGVDEPTKVKRGAEDSTTLVSLFEPAYKLNNEPIKMSGMATKEAP